MFQKDLAVEETNFNAILKKGEVILRFCHPTALQTIRYQIAILKRRWNDVAGWAKQRDTRLKEGLEKLLGEQRLIEILMMWITEEETIIIEREKIPLPDDYDAVHALLEEHKQSQTSATSKQTDYDQVTKHAKKRVGAERRRIPSVRTPGKGHEGSFIKEYCSPAVTQLAKRWQHLWLLLMDRLIRLQAKQDEIRIQKASAEFDWTLWRERFKTWLRESKSRVSDLWRRKDLDRDNKLSREEFVEALIETSFITERWEIELVFNMIEVTTLISYKDFVDALKNNAPAKKEKPKTEEDRIHYEIEREVEKCTCQRRYVIVKITEKKYYFGESQKLRMVRIMRTSVMVRVGGGWETLQHFLLKNDPCRAEGKSNLELRAKLFMPERGNSMQGFKYKRPGVSREGSSTGVRVRTPSREASGEIRRGVSSIPRRQKSDLERDQKKLPTYGTDDYMKVKSSGYGVSPMMRKKRPPSTGSLTADGKPRLRRSGSGLSTGSRDSLDGEAPKISRERSGDVFSRLYGQPKTKPTTPKETKPPARATSLKPRTPVKVEKKEPDTPTKPAAAASTKPRLGGVFARLTSTGTATKKATAETSPEKKTKTTAKKPSSSKDQKKEEGWKSVRGKPASRK